MALDPEEKRKRRLEAAKKRRGTSRQHQKDFRKEQMEHGRKAVTLWVDPEYYEIIHKAKEKFGEANIRDTAYLCLKKGIEQAMPEEFDEESE